MNLWNASICEPPDWQLRRKITELASRLTTHDSVKRLIDNSMVNLWDTWTKKLPQSSLQHAGTQGENNKACKQIDNRWICEMPQSSLQRSLVNPLNTWTTKLPQSVKRANAWLATHRKNNKTCKQIANHVDSYQIMQKEMCEWTQTQHMRMNRMRTTHEKSHDRHTYPTEKTINDTKLEIS